MGIVRNFINVIGIASKNELPNKINGQIVEYSDTEILFVPDDKPEINTIYEIMIDLKIKSIRKVNSSLSNIVIIDGERKHKIIYTENGDFERVNVLYLNMPYNTFVELPNNNVDIDINNISIHVLDAYFELISSRKIYSHVVYLIDVNYNNQNLKDKYYKQNIRFDVGKNIDIEVDKELSISKDEDIDSENSEFIDIDSEYL
ncbi:hypothetical protein [Tepidibacter thalassicus]|uniref:SipL SPOCS domain-containing protein n=1 Tax=Tepidibacter thalassicus DSM 15285 TaxID=1123350 RepID=A0A1M5PED1_9FIRM|nr:hypothetical protein [Tepidibacter thalassicus]SHH00146.1 hypothetical protein SAMN02744040_00438 [Tepidibacter thalassicus DSM 15285]